MAHYRRFAQVARLSLPITTLLLVACDPLYRIGARQYLAPSVSRGEDSTQSLRALAPRTASTTDTTPSFDVRGVANCLETTLRMSPEVTDVSRSREAKQLQTERAHMSFAFTDTSALGDERYANLSLKAPSGETPVVELYFMWLGTAKSVPLTDQRTRINIATAFLQTLLSACSLPAEEIECIAEGWGRDSACAAQLRSETE